MLNNTYEPELSKILRDLPYEAKCELYDKKCSGCGFAKMFIIGEGGRCLHQTNRIEEARHIVQVTGMSIQRYCSYSNDCYDDDLISLNVIAQNGCMLWNENRVIYESQQETEFIEVEEFDGSYIRESIYSKIVSQH